jgi:glucose-1-phosphate adenylyltransferase
MVTTEVDVEEAARFGVVRANTDGRVEDFAYKPERPQGNVVTTEVFVYDARTLLETLDGLAAAHDAKGDGGEGNPGGLRDFGHELLPELVRRGRAFAYPFDGYWRDVGTVESYWAGHMELLAEEPQLALDDPRWPILTYGSQRVPARVHAEARIENSLISPGCVIHGRVAGSVLAPGVVVGEGAVVRDSVILHDTRVEGHARVSNAIIDERVRVGAGAAVGSVDGGEATGSRVGSESKITLVGMGCEVPRDVNVEAGARLKPGGRVE